jgi:hypothetical protein
MFVMTLGGRAGVTVAAGNFVRMLSPVMIARNRPVVMLLVVSCLVGGCSSESRSSPGTAPASSASTSTTATAGLITLTDRRTVDPCGLVPLSVLTRFGRVQRGQSGEGGLLACDIYITSAGHGETGVRKQIDATPTSTRDIQLHDLVVEQIPGGLRTVRPRFENTQDAEGCVHEVDFADGSAVSVVAFEPSNLAADVFCMIGKATLAAVVATLRNGHIQRRHWPAGTLASRPDLCGMVPPKVRALVPGLGSAGLLASPGGATCIWNANNRVSLTWGIGAVPIGLASSANVPSPYEQHVKIAGRRTTLDSVVPGRCTAMTLGKPLDVVGFDGKPYQEQAIVVVYADRSPTDLCASTRNVATRIWPKLPR